MSTVRATTVTVICDRCQRPSNRFNTGEKAVTRLLARLKADGWSRQTNSMYVDLCPSCLAASRKEPT